MARDPGASLRRWTWAFALLSLWAFVFFVLSLWRDYAREWKGYQKTFLQMELSQAKEERERQIVRARDYELNQIIVAGGRRMDRCTTCHLGIEDPRFNNAPQPFRTHPAIAKHPFDKFGCTVCHQGQDMATTVKAAHGEVGFWEEPMLRGPYLQATCGGCHTGAELKEAPLLARGKQLYQEKGCVACHKVRGAGGSLGPDLSLVGTRRKDPAWHLKHFRDPQAISPGSTMPPFAALPEQDLQALTVFMLSLREAPSALAASTPLVASTTGGATHMSRTAPAPPAATGRATSTAGAPPPPGPGALARLSRAKVLYAEKSCVACHAIGGVGGKVGPDLTAEGGTPGRDLEWHVRHFRNPAAVVPGSIMPPLADLSEDDIKALAAYMLSLK
ncbi:MAG TPA: cbb3-type cytochrome c oxidase subunit II [Candidatus Methylomirabilis sp.]